MARVNGANTAAMIEVGLRISTGEAQGRKDVTIDYFVFDIEMGSPKSVEMSNRYH